MRKIKILLVGNASHQHIKKFSYWLRKKWAGSITIDVLTHVSVCSSDREFYDHIYYLNLSPSVFYRIPVFREIFRILWGYKNQLKKIRNNNYDILHIHFLFYYYFFGWKYLRESSHKIIITIWGNDYNGIGNIRKKIVHWMLNRADLVTLTNSTMIDTLKQNLKADCKITRTNYGLSPLDALMKIKNISRNEALQHFGLDEDKIIITCGYSNREEHHQLELINIIQSYPSEIKKRIFVIFPMTYGNEVENLRLVKKRLEQVSFDFMLFEEFLSDRETALLRKASDIFIHVVDYDQNSGAMFEYFYTDNIVIAGSWLPYKGLVDAGFSFQFVDSVQEVKKKLFSLLNNFNVKMVTSDINIKSYIENNRSWDNIIKVWCGLYRDLYES